MLVTIMSSKLYAMIKSFTTCDLKLKVLKLSFAKSCSNLFAAKSSVI